MDVMILDESDNIGMLRAVGEEWATAANSVTFSFDTDVNIGLGTMARLVWSGSGDVLVLMSGEVVKGFMGLSYQPSHVGPERIAHECCFYVTPSARSGGLKLISAAEKLARSKGCTHFVLNASRMAGDGDRSGMLYQRLGYAELETSYLKAL